MPISRGRDENRSDVYPIPKVFTYGKSVVVEPLSLIVSNRRLPTSGDEHDVAALLEAKEKGNLRFVNTSKLGLMF